MFEDGSLWRPPQMNPYSQGMPDELVEGRSSHAADEQGKKPGLTDGLVFLHTHRIADTHFTTFTVDILYL